MVLPRDGFVGHRNPKGVGSNPAPATKMKNSHRKMAVFRFVMRTDWNLLSFRYETDERGSLGDERDRRRRRMKGARGSAAVKIIKDVAVHPQIILLTARGA